MGLLMPPLTRKRAGVREGSSSWRCQDKRPQKRGPVRTAAALIIAPNCFGGRLPFATADFDKEFKHGLGQIRQRNSPAPLEASVTPCGEFKKAGKRRAALPDERRRLGEISAVGDQIPELGEPA